DRRNGMSRHPFVRRALVAAAALVVMLLAAPSAAPGSKRGPLDGPKNLRATAIAPHNVALAWDPAVNSGSFPYAIRASFGYQVGVPQTETGHPWPGPLLPGGPPADGDELHLDARPDPGQDVLVRHVGGRRERPGVREEQHRDGHASR